MFLIVVKDEDKDDVIKVIMRNLRIGEKGVFGDGKIFVVLIEEVYIVSSGKVEL